MPSNEEESHAPVRKDAKANGLKEYEYGELGKATGYFSMENFLGKGSFGEHFKGSLPAGEVIAIKKLEIMDKQWEKEFKEFINAFGTLRHENVVSLIGYCIDSFNRLLVSEFVPNKSLKYYLYDKERRSELKWSKRMEIAKYSAKGLAYLHKESSSRIIHGSVKAANILLDDSFKPKVAEFGLAKFYSKIDHKSHSSQNVCEELDVYSFGIVLLELIMGKNVQDEDIEKARALMNKGDDLVKDDYARLIDSQLKGHYDANEVERMIYCVAICIFKPLKSRPNMEKIVEVLEGKKSAKELWLVNSQQDSPPYGPPEEFTYEVLAKTTYHFSNEFFLGRGGFGEVFKGMLSFKENNRETPQSHKVAIKKLIHDKDNPGKEDSEKEIKAVGTVRHRNLVRLMGYCCNEYDRLLVLEFVPNNSLRFHLDEKRRSNLKWPIRMQIAKGSAKGLAYLHKNCNPKIIHRDIKADNILLDNEFEPKITDFGLARFFPQTGSVTHISTGLKGTPIYADPEKYPTQKLSEKSDIYSFGVLLLELITGRDPLQDDESIVEWAKSLIMERDDSIKIDYVKLVDSKLDVYNENEMKQMIYCAAASVYKPSIHRPSMEQIVQTLEGNLSPEDLWFMKDNTSQQGKLSRKPHPNELKPPSLPKLYAYEELANVTGSFCGKHLRRDDYLFQVYEGYLSSSNQKVAIKKLKHVSVQRKVFEEEIKAINNVCHRNIVTFIGYCSDEGNNRLLVFELVSKESLSSHLHAGNKGSTYLDWPNRMKIAKGLAEGLKYMHEDCQPRILHLYVKSDNVFLDEKFEPKLAEFGSAKLFPDTVTHVSVKEIMKNSGYMAPEYDITKKNTLTDKFDVYSFGIILLELITGKPPVGGDYDGHTTIINWAMSQLPRNISKESLSKSKDNLVDEKLKEYNTDEMVRMIACAEACVRSNHQHRPQMSQILQVLKGDSSLETLDVKETIAGPNT